MVFKQQPVDDNLNKGRGDHEDKAQIIAYVYPWYESIEEGVREIVFILRNGGFNTTSACHHTMKIFIDVDAGKLGEVYDLMDKHWKQFWFEFYWDHNVDYTEELVIHLGNRYEQS